MGLVDLSGVSGKVIAALSEVLKQDADVKRFEAYRKQRAIARASQDDRKAVEGLGRMRLQITPEAYHYWGQRLGYGCWRDKQFLREFERDNQECRVKSGGTRTQVGFVKFEGNDGPFNTEGTENTESTEGKRIKFRKVYA